MKRIPINECPAGAEIDAAVEEAQGRPGYFSDYVIINEKRYDIETWIRKPWTPEQPQPGQRIGRMPRKYSTDIQAAWELVESRIAENEKNVFDVVSSREPGLRWMAFFDRGKKVRSAMADTAPLAITRAYLNAKGVVFVEVPE